MQQIFRAVTRQGYDYPGVLVAEEAYLDNVEVRLFLCLTDGLGISEDFEMEDLYNAVFREFANIEWVVDNVRAFLDIDLAVVVYEAQIVNVRHLLTLKLAIQDFWPVNNLVALELHHLDLAV